MSRTEFIEAVWEDLGAKGPTDFARKLGLGPDGLQKVRRWRHGGRLDYEDVMQMLARTGWWTPGQRSTSPGQGDRLEELAMNDASLLANQEEALKNQGVLLAELRAIREALDSLAGAARTQPKRTRASR